MDTDTRSGIHTDTHTDAHTLVLDIGKSHAKLLLFDAAGEVLARSVQANAPAEAEEGYTALGTAALEAWLTRAIPDLPGRERIGRIGITTHGAAFCALGDEGLVLPPLDYEWDGYGPWRERYAERVDGFEITGSPFLPQGLNAGLQLWWLQQTRPQAWAQVRHWVPYPQYWAWWFTGQRASEATSLGCHTHLWQPHQHMYAPWAMRLGLVKHFAPLRPAHAVLGTVRPERARVLGLSPACQVHVGLHDSNACLARHLHAAPQATVVSTGTWTVVMRAGQDVGARLSLDPRRDELFNQSIDGRAVPTARFMGGREFAFLCHGADPALATLPALREALDAGWQVLPDNPEHAGAVPGRVAALQQGAQRWGRAPEVVPAHWRPALAAWYAAALTAQNVQRLCSVPSNESNSETTHEPVIVEGPMADNAAFTAALAALLAPRPLLRSTDAVEGTARGAWLSTRWHQPDTHLRYALLPRPAVGDALPLQQAGWRWHELCLRGH